MLLKWKSVRSVKSVVAALLFLILPFALARCWILHNHVDLSEELMRASMGRYSTVTVIGLVALGADVNARDDGGGTALFYAAANGRAYNARVLLVSGADPTIRDNQNNTALCEATYFAKGNVKSMDALLNSVADPAGAVDDALLCIGDGEGRNEKIHFLIDRAVKNNGHLSRGIEALVAYSRNGYYDGIDYLVKVGRVDVNERNRKGETALMAASSVCSVRSVKELLSDGADVTIKNDMRETALDIAQKANINEYSITQKDCSEVMKLLTSELAKHP